MWGYVSSSYISLFVLRYQMAKSQSPLFRDVMCFDTESRRRPPSSPPPPPPFFSVVMYRLPLPEEDQSTSWMKIRGESGPHIVYSNTVMNEIPPVEGSGLRGVWPSLYPSFAPRGPQECPYMYVPQNNNTSTWTIQVYIYIIHFHFHNCIK